MSLRSCGLLALILIAKGHPSKVAFVLLRGGAAGGSLSRRQARVSFPAFPEFMFGTTDFNDRYSST
jgi:hypothetical protein